MEILLVHGLFGSLTASTFAKAFGSAHLNAPDMPGYGNFRCSHQNEPSLSLQAEHLARFIEQTVRAPVHIVGHSVGGAIALLLAHRYPSLVCSYTSVEGNMTIKDAFWSAQIAEMPLSGVEALINGYKQDVAGWIAAAGVVATERTLATAASWLDNQPASTIRAQARAVVDATQAADYLGKLEALRGRGLPIHLLAGENSLDNWDLPSWVQAASASLTVVPGRGHLMMLEDPEAIAAIIAPRPLWWH